MPRDLIPSPETQLVPAHGLADLLKSAQTFAEQAQAAHTRRAYACHWKSFDGWCREPFADQPGLSFVSLPADPATVALYLTAQAQAGKKVATIEARLAGHRRQTQRRRVHPRPDIAAASGHAAGLERHQAKQTRRPDPQGCGHDGYFDQDVGSVAGFAARSARSGFVAAGLCGGRFAVPSWSRSMWQTCARSRAATSFS